jgi:hypothetical protein
MLIEILLVHIIYGQLSPEMYGFLGTWYSEFCSYITCPMKQCALFQRSRTNVVAPVLNKPELTVARPQQVTPPTTTKFLKPQQEYVAVPVPVQPILAAAGFSGTVVASLPPPSEV